MVQKKGLKDMKFNFLEKQSSRREMLQRCLGAIDELDSNERNALSNIPKRLTTRYDNLFQTSFPYSMGSHQRPTDGREHPEWHFHAPLFPLLLRSATVRKFAVGFDC